MTSVRIVTDARARARAECAGCPWVSPWATPGPAWPDAAARPPAVVSRVVERAAARHLYAVHSRPAP